MEIPEAMIETQCENMINEFAQRIAQSGLSMEQYMQFSGMTIDGLKEQVRPEAETRIKSSLVLEQIAKKRTSKFLKMRSMQKLRRWQLSTEWKLTS